MNLIRKDALMDHTPRDAFMNNTPKDAVMDHTPKDAVVNNTPKDPVMNNTPKDPYQRPTAKNHRRFNSVWIDEFDNVLVTEDESEDQIFSRDRTFAQQKDAMLFSRIRSHDYPIRSTQWIDHRLSLLADEHFVEGLVEGFGAVLMSGIVLGLLAMSIKKRKRQSNQHHQFAVESTYSNSDLKTEV